MLTTYHLIKSWEKTEKKKKKKKPCVSQVENVKN